MEAAKALLEDEAMFAEFVEAYQDLDEDCNQSLKGEIKNWKDAVRIKFVCFENLLELKFGT